MKGNEEQWAKIKGIDGAYISNLGRAKSITRLGERVLKPQLYKKGNSYRVMFDRRRTQGKAFYKFIGTLVGEYHVKKEGMRGNVVYRDGNRLNPSADNITYAYYDHKRWDEDIKEHVIKGLSESTSPINGWVISYITTGKELYISKVINAVKDSICSRVAWQINYNVSDVEECLISCVFDLIDWLHKFDFSRREGNFKFASLLYIFTYKIACRKKSADKGVEFVSSRAFNDQGEGIDLWDLNEQYSSGFNGEYEYMR